MRAQAAATITPSGGITHLAGRPPLTLRQVRDDDPATAGLCVVGSAAGPLPGDELALTLDVRDGACARLSAAGAMIAQGRDGAAATLTTRVTVGDRAHLDGDPGALVVCAGARVDVHLRITLAASATLIWRELLVLGRTGEAPGAVTLNWTVDRAERPLLRQSIELVDPALTRWPGVLGANRVLATALVVGPVARTRVLHPAAVAQRLDGADGSATLCTVLGADAARAADDLSVLVAGLR